MVKTYLQIYKYSLYIIILIVLIKSNHITQLKLNKYTIKIK